jgi:hypothetical protein
MTRLQDRFNQAKQIPTPDLADELRHRLGYDAHPVEAGRNPIGQRVLVGAVALIIFLVAGAFAWRAFRPGTAMTASGAPSDVLQVQCDANSVQVSTPVVAAQADGVHILGSVTGIPDADILVRSSGDPSATYASASSGVDGEFVRGVPPGDARVGCASDPMNESRMNDALTASFTIVDPDGFFVPYVPGCSDTAGIGPPRIVFTDQPPPATPEDAVRSDIDGLQPDDVVELAGYVQAREALQIVRITRDGDIIGSFHVDGRDGGFEVIAGFVCTDSGLTQKNSGLVRTG